MDDDAFKDFAEKIAEARTLLARSEVLARENLAAEKQLARLRDECSRAEDRLTAVRQETARDEERFTHEKTRHEAALQLIIAGCETAEAGARAQADGRIAAAYADAARVEQETVTARRTLERDLRDLRTQRDVLANQLETFKARIAAL